MRLFSLTIGFIVSLLAHPLWGQSEKSFVVETIGLRQGLPTADIRALFRDAKGYLWLGTDIGLVRYDGYRFETISVSQEGRWLGIVNSIVEDKNGLLWVGTEDGLFMVEHGIAHAVKQLQTDPFLRMNCLLFDKRQNLWCATSSGVYRLTASDLQKIARSPATSVQPKPLPGYQKLVPKAEQQRVFTLAFDELGRLYAGAYSGLFRYEAGSRRAGAAGSPLVRLWPDRNRTVEIQALAVRGTDDIVFTTFDPLGYIRLHNGHEERYFPNIYSADVICHQNQFWYLSCGLHRQGPADSRPVQQLDLYKKITGSFTKLYIDPEGIFWVATNKGVLKIRGSIFDPIKLPQTVNGAEINGFGVYNNQLLVGAHRGRVFSWEGDSLTKKLGDLAPIAGVSAIRQDQHQTLWLGTTYQGLFSFDGKQIRRYTQADGLSDEAFNDIIPAWSGRTRPGQRLAGGTRSDDLWAVGDMGITRIRYNGTPAKPYQLTFYEHKLNRYKFTIFYSGLDTPDGTLWLASDFGLVSFRDGKFYNHLLTVNQTTVRSVRKIVQEKSGHIWLATEGSGLLEGQLINDQFRLIRQYTQQDGLPSNTFSDLLVDSTGRIWAGSSTALSCLSVSQSRVQIQNFDYKDGFFGESFQNPRLLEYPAGTLRISSTEGLMRLPLERLGPKTPLLPVYITDIRLRDEPGGGSLLALPANQQPDGSQRQQLAARQNALTFRFALISLVNPTFNRYRYRLEGADQAWQMTPGDKNFAIYSGLKPGQYDFFVSGASANGVWSSPASYSFEILPPVWQRGWFIALILAVLFVSVWSFIRYRERRVKQQETEKNRLAQLIAELETKAIRAQMNPHFIFNCLNSIQECILANNTDAAYGYLSKFSRLLRMVLEESARNFHSIQHELDLIGLYLELESLRFDQPLNYTITVSPGVDTQNWQIPSLLLQPLIENAIWHGLVHQTGNRQLTLTVQTDGPLLLTCTVDDNGVGRQRAAALSARNFMTHTSKGLALVTERLLLMEPAGHGQGKLHIEDLTGTDGHPTGTRVQIYLPVITQLAVRTNLHYPLTNVSRLSH